MLPYLAQEKRRLHWGAQSLQFLLENQKFMQGDKILVVDDEKAAREGLCALLSSWGYRTEAASKDQEAISGVRRFRPDAAVVDLVMPGMGGLELLKVLKEEAPFLSVIMLTAHGDIDSAVRAIKEGADDFLTKPVDIKRLEMALSKALERSRHVREIHLLRARLREAGYFGRMVGASAPMRAVYRTIEQAAGSDASVIIYGESGTGKELVARTLHELSPRRDGPFVALNCAALPESLLESEIFGHERGAFTGAVARRIGYFELAQGGTLLLDEICDMPINLQSKLLRVLEEKRLRRLGGEKEVQLDVRVLVCSSRAPATALAEGLLREDLYYRLSVFTIGLPPLRERKEDIVLLVQAFVEEMNSQTGKKVLSLDNQALVLVQQYGWPGNVRELRNVIQRAVIVSSSELVTNEDLPSHIIRGMPLLDTQTSLAPGMTLEEAEYRLISKTLEITGNNKSQAAKMLGISLRTLYNKLERMGE